MKLAAVTGVAELGGLDEVLDKVVGRGFDADTAEFRTKLRRDTVL